MTSTAIIVPDTVIIPPNTIDDVAIKRVMERQTLHHRAGPSGPSEVIGYMSPTSPAYSLQLFLKITAV
ncbi:conserved hypothetical protein [Ricinus communis]|uniref:Uncharacterized protein n=1 Tax=Ricinus communis TaxID=3988 RepID=B9RYR4_RICCO|nr:conserved hypothetical protein [Ricinus communis]